MGINPEAGRQRYATRAVRGTRREATRQRALRVTETDNARLHAGSVEDLLERWFAAAARGWAPTTVAHTRSIIDCHLIPQLGHLPVAKVITADIDDFYGWLLTFGGGNRKGLSPGTVWRVHSVLHRALVQALCWKWIWINPASQANPPRVRRTEIRPLALRWADVDLARGGAVLGREAFVFSNDADGRTPWAPNWTTKQFIAARRAADLPPFRLHDLRHFLATMMLSQAVPLAVVSQRLNRVRISTAVNVYAHAIPAWDRSAAETLAGLLERDPDSAVRSQLVGRPGCFKERGLRRGGDLSSWMAGWRSPWDA
jgi:integrase